MSAGSSHLSSSDRLEVVLNALIEPVVVTDSAGVVTFVNRAAVERLDAAKYVGVALAEQLTNGHVRAADGAPLAWDQHPVARTLSSGQASAAMTVSVRGVGDTRADWMIRATPLSEGERVSGAILVFDAVKVATDLESELADHAARLEAIVNLVSDAVFVADRDGRLVFMNAIGRSLLGLAGDTTVVDRHRRLDVRDADGHPLPLEAMPSSRALRGEQMSPVVLLIRDSGDQLRQVVTNAHPLRRPDGSIYAALVTMNDVTDEMRSRRELEAARESAEEANHLKDQFIAALSHELRTPLQPILGWTEVLRRHGNLDALTTQALEAIRRNIRQQVRLVDDLLDLSRIVHGKLALRYETFDLREQIKSAAEPFEEAAALKRVRLTLSLPPEPILMWGDGVRVHQIATNLVSNAMKFTPAGRQVSIQLLARETDAILEVEDTGEGITPEDLAVIFEPFRQGGGPRRRGGLGIGLDLVRRLAELHGGTVEATSDGPGYGARFTVRLPLGHPGTTVRAATPPIGRRLDGRHILIIEDNADTREVMRFMLESEGAQVEIAGSGEEGLARAKARAPEIVLCDIGLPDVDGLEVARRMRREIPGSPRLIALSGYGQPEDVHHALDAGFEAHLTKPINLDELLSLLAERESPGEATRYRGG